MADNAFATKLLNERCLECSSCAMFFNSSLTVSIKTRFLIKILAAILIRLFLMLFFAFVTIRCSLNPKNQPIGHFPRSASPSKGLWIDMRWLRHTPKGDRVDETNTCTGSQRDLLDENAQRETMLPSSVPRNGYRTPGVKTGVSDVYGHIPCDNAWNSGNLPNETG